MNIIVNRAKLFGKDFVNFCLVVLLALSASCLLWGMPTAWASINDDRLDGNIFVVYAGNGSLVPPRLTLAESLKRKRPAVLVYYLDDSSDCKQFAIVVSRIQEFYGRAASIIPVSVDSLPVKSAYDPQELGYYYAGVVPQTVILDEAGKVVFNGKGQVKYEEVDDVLRDVFDLLPRSESVELKRRSFNEFNTELVGDR
jgi:peroxiredoxin